jgi:hypothetical protein
MTIFTILYFLMFIGMKLLVTCLVYPYSLLSSPFSFLSPLLSLLPPLLSALTPLSSLLSPLSPLCFEPRKAFQGYDKRWWKSRHNAHHVNTNECLHDPDIAIAPLFHFVQQYPPERQNMGGGGEEGEWMR